MSSPLTKNSTYKRIQHLYSVERIWRPMFVDKWVVKAQQRNLLCDQTQFGSNGTLVTAWSIAISSSNLHICIRTTFSSDKVYIQGSIFSAIRSFDINNKILEHETQYHSRMSSKINDSSFVY